MAFQLLVGFNNGKNPLLYLREDKRLFVQKISRYGKTEYICYDSILSGKNKAECCRARVTISGEACTRNQIAHSCNGTHEIIYRDLNSLNEMRERCRSLRFACDTSSHKISVKDIFLQVIAK